MLTGAQAIARAERKLDAEIQKNLMVARAEILVLREHCEAAIFGQSQKFGIRVMTNGFFVPAQFELIGRPASHTLFIGQAGTGKTALANFVFRKFAKFQNEIMVTNVTEITGMGDMTPAQLVGHIEFLPTKNERGEDVILEKLRPGYIVAGRNFLLIDEALRLPQEGFNPIRHVVTMGKIVLGPHEIEIAPEGESFFVISTANPPGSAGTRTPGQFFADGITGCAILRTEYEDDAYLRALLQPRKHWPRIIEEGISRPIMTPQRLTEMQELFKKNMHTPARVEDYMMRVIRAIQTLTQPRWMESGHFKGKPLPKAWSAMKRIPTLPLVDEPGGRKPQHFETMAAADSLLTYGSMQSVIPAAQAMARAVYAFPIMVNLADGGLDIRDAAYGGSKGILEFTNDLLDYVVRCVEVPR